MHKKNPHPSWWLLYLSLPMLIGLFLLELRLSLSETGHRFTEFIIILIVFGSMFLWLDANKGALIQEDLERWHTALRADSSPISPQSEKIVQPNGNLKRQPQQVRGNILRRLARWASAVSGFFHF